MGKIFKAQQLDLMVLQFGAVQLSGFISVHLSLVLTLCIMAEIDLLAFHVYSVNHFPIPSPHPQHLIPLLLKLVWENILRPAIAALLLLVILCANLTST